MDHCKYCDARGDMARCENLSCSIHDDWITKELQARIEHIEQAISNAAHELSHRYVCPALDHSQCPDCIKCWRDYLTGETIREGDNDERSGVMNFKEQCDTIEQCLPVSDFRVQVARTHNDMLERIAQLERALWRACEQAEKWDCPNEGPCKYPDAPRETCITHWYEHMMLESEGE